MNDDSQALAIEGIRFFGEISASISHEIKNVLAIINENAGLLEDMILMNEKGLPLDPERLSKLAHSITGQVARGDRIVKGMNRFAHSADAASETVDVNEVIHFLSELAARLIAMKGPPPQINPSPMPLSIITSRFFLEHLLWACLCRAMDACLPGQTVSVVAAKEENTIGIRFCGLSGDRLDNETEFPAPRETLVARIIGAKLAVSGEKGEISLSLPPALDNTDPSAGRDYKK